MWFAWGGVGIVVLSVVRVKINTEGCGVCGECLVFRFRSSNA